MHITFPRVLWGAAVGAALASCGATPTVTADFTDVIPLPHSVEMADSAAAPFRLDSKTVIAVAADSLSKEAGMLAGYLRALTGHQPKVEPLTDPAQAGAIILRADLAASNPEAYTIDVTSADVTINGATSAGTFYGIQTLRKAIPVMEAGVKAQDVDLPAVAVADEPDFGYRGIHLDVARHFFPTDSIKKFLDMAAMHDINRFHWHLTDDQGWRLEIKSHPKLTQVGSQRTGTCVGHDFNTTDSVPYGGFYTQEEVRDIVRYAADRHITVIPEIDLPGHMLGALKVYPELGCTGGPYEVWTHWGVSQDVLCAGNPDTYKFLDQVFDEVLQLFPSEYIHVGGDECPKTRWKECAKCQAKARELGLKDGPQGTVEEQLQSYVIHHMSDYLTAHGRKMIGWDETLEGGLAPGAVIMSWRGVDGAIAAANQGHDAIMTPNSAVYFDYYQTQDREGEPEAIGGYLPVQIVYAFDPFPEGITPEQRRHITGIQANIWTEYMKDFPQVQYMALPRMAALAEVQWNGKQPVRDYEAFLRRMPNMMAHYGLEDMRYATHLLDVSAQMEPDSASHAIKMRLLTLGDAQVRYTLDGSAPTMESALYQGPVSITADARIRATAFRDGGAKPSRTMADSVTVNLATFSPVTLTNKPSQRWTQTPSTLVDGLFGALSYNSGHYLGFVKGTGPLDATIDLGKTQRISNVTVRDLVNTGEWVFGPQSIEVLTSDNGRDWTPRLRRDYQPVPKDQTVIQTNVLDLPAPVQARWVRVVVTPLEAMPDWHGAKGQPGWLFVDEVMVR